MKMTWLCNSSFCSCMLPKQRRSSSYRVRTALHIKDKRLFLAGKVWRCSSPVEGLSAELQLLFSQPDSCHLYYGGGSRCSVDCNQTNSSCCVAKQLRNKTTAIDIWSTVYRPPPASRLCYCYVWGVVITTVASSARGPRRFKQCFHT